MRERIITRIGWKKIENIGRKIKVIEEAIKNGFFVYIKLSPIEILLNTYPIFSDIIGIKTKEMGNTEEIV